MSRDPDFYKVGCKVEIGNSPDSREQPLTIARAIVRRMEAGHPTLAVSLMLNRRAALGIMHDGIIWIQSTRRQNGVSCVVLQRLSDQIRSCLERAAEAKRKADATANPALKTDYLEAEERWLTLARSYEFTDRVGDFTAAISHRLKESKEHARTDVVRDDALLLQEISTLLIREGDIAALYERILDGAVRLMSSDMGSMQVLDPARNELRLLAWRGFHPESATFWDRVRGDSVHVSCGVAFSSGRRVIVSDSEASDFMAGSADLDHYRLSGIRAVQSTPLVSRSGQLLGMISTHWCEPHQPSERDLLLLDVLARQAADLIERTHTETALRESEARSRGLASIVESSDDAVVSQTFDGIITTWNKGAERIFGYTAEEAVGKPITMLIPRNRREEETRTIERIRRGERVEPYETVRQRKHGNLIEIALTVSPMKNANGKIAGVSKVSHDISERKRKDEQIADLAREAEHRTKNILATVQAAVQLSHADTPDALKRAIEGRIHALANVHALFIETRWIGADVHSLVTQELSPYSQGQEVRISGPDLLLEPNTAQTIAMAMHELATNAAKYGALSKPGGRVAIEWSPTSDGRLVLRWTETDGPACKMPEHQGFGRRLIEAMIRSLKVKYISTGVRRDLRPKLLFRQRRLDHSSWRAGQVMGMEQEHLALNDKHIAPGRTKICSM